jgi:hypothetical protein
MRYRMLLALGLAVTATLLVTSQVFGGTYLNTIEPVATMNGRHLQVTIIYGCTQTQSVTLRVTATQRNVGAVAQGWRTTTCGQAVEHIPVNLTTFGVNRFIPTLDASQDQVVEICALGLTSINGQTDDSHQWCKEVTLQVDSSLNVRGSASPFDSRMRFH